MLALNLSPDLERKLSHISEKKRDSFVEQAIENHFLMEEYWRVSDEESDLQKEAKQRAKNLTLSREEIRARMVEVLVEIGGGDESDD